MHRGAANLTYLARGRRNYGLRPVLGGQPRGRWELQWILRGRARPFRANEEPVATEGPCLHVSHPDSPHGWTDETAGESEVFVLQFKSIPEELAARVKPAKTLTIPLREEERRTLQTRLNEVWEMSRAGDSRLGLKLDQTLVETALLALGRSAPETRRGPMADRVERALHWLGENLGENPSIAAAARAAGVSAAHLRRLFAEAGRDTPHAELARLRMLAARRCLREGWKLERVAAYLGFSEASAFSRAFSAECGMSPRKWLAADRESERP